jgi:hypothetical protein
MPPLRTANHQTLMLNTSSSLAHTVLGIIMYFCCFMYLGEWSLQSVPLASPHYNAQLLLLQIRFRVHSAAVHLIF